MQAIRAKAVQDRVNVEIVPEETGEAKGNCETIQSANVNVVREEVAVVGEDENPEEERIANYQERRCECGCDPPFPEGTFKKKEKKVAPNKSPSHRHFRRFRFGEEDACRLVVSDGC